MPKKIHFHLNGKTVVYLDWANVYGWTNSLKKEVSIEELANLLSSLQEIKKINFYYGYSEKQGSKDFINKVKALNFHICSKPVKKILIDRKSQKYKMKCNFDIEIAIAAVTEAPSFQTFLFFSGDGDFCPLYEYLLTQKKKVIVVFGSGHLGREVSQMGDRVYLLDVKKIKGIF